MVNNLSELKKLLQICRKAGVTEINLGSVSFKLGDLPQEQRSTTQGSMDEEDIVDPYANFPGGMLTPSQLAFYSAGGVPEEDPEIEGNQQ